MVKAAVMNGFNEPLTIEALALKPPRDDEVVVRVAASGICHSDLSVLQGKIPLPPPAVLGHEGAGVVEEVGKAVSGLEPGDHVVLSWVQNCGRCPYCNAGTPHLCEGTIQAAMAGEDFVFQRDGVPVGRLAGVGSFAERTVVRATAAIKIPHEMPLDCACLVGCGVMTGIGAAINTVDIHPGDTVAVFGCGGVGLNVIQGAALRGPSRIIAVDLVEQKLHWAREFGATDAINAREAVDVAGAVKEITGGHGVHYAFEVIGAPAVIAQAFMSLRRGGKVVVVGVPAFTDQITVPAVMFPLEEKSIVGSLYGSANMRRDVPRLVDLYMHKRIKIDELISRRIALDDIDAAFSAMEKGEVARSVIVYG